LVSAGITVFLVIQVAVPVSYYFANEPTLERFSWRMFSSVDLSSWDTHVYVIAEQDGRLVQRELQLQKYLQETNVKTLQKAQLDVVVPFMQRISQEPGVREVRYEARGTFPSGKPMQPIRLSLKPGEAVVRQRE
jgi:hypothetical protein